MAFQLNSDLITSTSWNKWCNDKLNSLKSRGKTNFYEEFKNTRSDFIEFFSMSGADLKQIKMTLDSIQLLCG